MKLPDHPLWQELRAKPRWLQRLIQLLPALCLLLLGLYGVLAPRYGQRQQAEEALQQISTEWVVQIWQLSALLQAEAKHDQEWQQRYQQLFSVADSSDALAEYLAEPLTLTGSQLQSFHRLPLAEGVTWLQHAWQIEISGHYAGLLCLLQLLSQRPELLLIEQLEITLESPGNALVSNVVSINNTTRPQLRLKARIICYWPQEVAP